MLTYPKSARFDSPSDPALIPPRQTVVLPAGVAELADAQDLGSCTERCRGSTPLSCIRPGLSGVPGKAGSPRHPTAPAVGRCPLSPGPLPGRTIASPPGND